MKAAAETEDLQRPSDVSTRNSAYSLPGSAWAVTVGALGVGGGDVFAKLGVGYGFGAGVMAEVNIAHASIGLLNASAAWHFVDTRHFDLGARLGFWYGHGAWMWILYEPAQKLAAKVDMIAVPMALTASAPLARWLELDLGAEYSYADIFGAAADEESIFVDTRLAVRQFGLRPGARLFLTDRTALELSSLLPLHTVIPLERGDVTLPFSETWSFEVGLRSRFAQGLFGTVRVHYGEVAKVLYGARVYPSFEVEYRP